ncbi:MAG: RNA 2'-phosphotransferase [Longimicrobiaceae bacterium]
MDPSLVRASRFLSLVLRHRPEHVGIALDPAGWVPVDELLAAARRSGFALDRAMLERVVAENDKRRFAFSADGARIRASQGHSVDVDLGLTAQAPPAVLFHGTATRFLESIRREGLRPGSRTHVHLSPDEATARTVGRRHGAPVVLRVAAGDMHRDGHELVLSENGVWLARTVPAMYLGFP